MNLQRSSDPLAVFKEPTSKGREGEEEEEEGVERERDGKSGKWMVKGGKR